MRARLSGAAFLALWLGLAAAAPAQLASGPGYEAFLADGTRIEGSRINGWFGSPIDEAQLSGEKLELFGSPANPVRLVRQLAATQPRVAAPYLELANGDVLPGRVLSAEVAGSEEDARLVVAVDSNLTAGGQLAGRVTLRAAWVARIVGSPRAASAAPPNTAVGLDGEQMAYRSFRWMPEGVRLLTDEGVRIVPYASLGQLAPPVDRTTVLLAEAAQAAAEGTPFLMRVVTRHGAVLTTSRTERETIRRTGRLFGRGNPTYEEIDIEYVQPAWSLGVLSLATSDAVVRGFRAPHDIPLSLLPIETVEQRSLVGVVQTRRPSAAADSGWLSAGPRVADLGLAVRSRTILRAALPPGSLEFSGWVGLDRAVGPGGCVVVQLFPGAPSGEPLWASGFLQGKDGPRRIDAVPLDGISHLTLVTDFGHEGRPDGADPLDIRDEVVWLGPTVRVADEILEAADRWRGVVPGWQGWSLPAQMPEEMLLTSRWNVLSSRWDAVLAVGEAPLVLKRRVQVAAYANDILELELAGQTRYINRDDGSLHACELRVGDTALTPVLNLERLQPRDDYSDPGRRGRITRPGPRVNPIGTFSLWWDLQEYRGQEVELVLTIRRPPARELLWRELRLRSAAAGLRTGTPLVPDVPLADLPALDPKFGDRGLPTANSLPNSRGGSGDPLTLIGQRFPSGYGMTRDSSVSFALKPEFKRFVALVGSAGSRTGPFKVLLDGEPAWTHATLDSTSGAQEVVVEIPPGTKRLTLETGPEGSWTGYTVWANAGFVK